MKASNFRYVKPASLADALDVLAEHGESAQPLAGGQSLMPLMNLRLAAPPVLVDLNGLEDLKGIRREGAHVVIGALTRHSEIAGNEIVGASLPLLASAAPHIAHVAIRSRGTLGGSVALADPAAEWPACCLALGAEIELASRAGRRRVPAVEFFQGLYTTSRRADELVVAVRFSVASADAVHMFREVSRRRGDFAIAGLALVAERRVTVLSGVRIALLGVADRPVLATKAMAAIENRVLDDSRIQAATAQLLEEIDPPEDPAYPASYRRRVAGGLLERTLKELIAGMSHAA